MTWIPNELGGANMILVEFLDFLMEPKGLLYLLYFMHTCIYSLSLPPSLGWLLKLWECVSSKGVVVFSASDQWTAGTIQKYIGEW